MARLWNSGLAHLLKVSVSADWAGLETLPPETLDKLGLERKEKTDVAWEQRDAAPNKRSKQK
mgnify:CR=1 FL=1